MRVLIQRFVFGSLALLATSESMANDYQFQKITPDSFQLDFEEKVFEGEGFSLPEPAKQPDLDYLDQIPFFLKNIQFTGINDDLAAELLSELSDHLNQQIRVGDLYRFANELTLYLMNKGYVLGRAVIPAQKLASGEVRFAVILGRISAVAVNGKSSDDINDDLIEHRLNLIKAQPITTSEVLSRQVLLINDLPGYTLGGSLSASETVSGGAEFDAKLNHKPYDVFFKMNNFGDDYTGKYRFSYLFATNDLFDLHEKLSFGVSFSSRWDQLSSFTLGYYAPMGFSDWFLSSSLYYSQSKPQADLKTLEIEGQTYGFDVAAIYPYIRKQTLNLNFDVGFATYSSQQDTLFGRNSDSKVIRLDFGLSGDRVDSTGFIAYSAKLKKGLDMLYTGTTTQTTPQSASLDFLKFEASLQRKQSLYFDHLSALLKLDYQAGTDLLLSTERASYGAENYGRGLTYSAISGDVGLAAALDIRYDLFAVPLVSRLSPYVFADYASVSRENKDPEASTSIEVIGLGAEVAFGKNLFANAFVSETDYEDKLDQAIHFQAYLRF